MLDLAAELALRLAGAHDDEVDQVVTEALASLAGPAGADRSYITLFFDDGTIANSHEWTARGVVPQQPAIQRLPGDDYSHTTNLARACGVWAEPDLERSGPEVAPERHSFTSFGVRAVLQVPIVVSNRGIGVIGLNYFAPTDPWTDEFVDAVLRVGQVIGVVIERHRALEDARRASEVAERANRLKDELLAHVSHEFRNPLHAILGHAELVDTSGLSDPDRDSLSQIQLSGRHLLTLVEDMLAIAGGTDRTPVDIELAPAVQHAIDALAGFFEHQGISVGIDPGIGRRRVRTDPGRLRQVLYCALSGAVGALRHGATVSIGQTAASTVSIELDGVNRSGDLVMPLARALIEGHGSITTTSDAERATIELRFG